MTAKRQTITAPQTDETERNVHHRVHQPPGCQTGSQTKCLNRFAVETLNPKSIDVDFLINWPENN